MGPDAEARIDEALRTGARELDLSRCDLNSLPDSLRNLTSLTTLDLRRNWLTGLPDWFGELNLPFPVELELSGNELTTFPKWARRFVGCGAVMRVPWGT